MPKPSQQDTQVVFAELVKRCADKAYNFAFRLAGNETDARDLVQEAFSRALKNFADYDEKRPFAPWLNRILKNIFLDQVRRYERTHTVALDAPPPMQEDTQWETLLPGKDLSPDQELEKKDSGEIVQEALALVPHAYRVAVILCDIEQYSYQQISEVLECPIGTVRSRIHQGRLLLKKSYEELQFGKKLAAR